MPRDRLTVITGLSGSGKSSLAFDTIYAEGQRRYVESLSAYARQFLGQMEKPDVDQIDGLSPAISIDQKGASKNPALHGRHGDRGLRLPAPAVRTRGAPALPVRPRDHAHDRVPDRGPHPRPAGRDAAARPGTRHPRSQDRGRPSVRGGAQAGLRARAGGWRAVRPRCGATLDKYKRHTIEVVVDRLVVHHEDEDGAAYGPDHPNPDAARLADSVETAMRLGEGVVVVAPADPDGFVEQQYSERYSCPIDGSTIDELEPRSFSFNSPHGACPECTGLGMRMEFDPERIIPDKSRSIPDGAVAPWRTVPTELSWRLKTNEAVFKSHGWDYRKPIRDLPPRRSSTCCTPARARSRWSSSTATPGAPTRTSPTSRASSPTSSGRYRETDSEYMKTEFEKYMVERPCRCAAASGSSRRSWASPSTVATSRTSRHSR